MKYKQQLKNNLHLVIAFTILITVAVVSAYTRDSKENPISRPIEVDTIIPKGYVLVPLELENREAISSVIQNFGIIDLFCGNPDGGRSRKIASRIKLIRAPYNPNQFAALVKEQLSERIMKESGQFYAVIQNKAEQEGENDNIPIQTKKSISIEYQK
ncbi:MAG: hypothetical protein H7Z71_00275 [Moraxellaceae bacterium]|nr:hypothetical protein [Pseudobdellovibrionaceae bacterium]